MKLVIKCQALTAVESITHEKMGCIVYEINYLKALSACSVVNFQYIHIFLPHPRKIFFFTQSTAKISVSLELPHILSHFIATLCGRPTLISIQL